MRECKKCHAKIPINIIIDGKTHNLQRRKYCLDCSPFGLRNTKQLEKAAESEIKHCYQCDRDFRITTKEGRSYWKRNTLCFGCYIKNRRIEFKKRLIEHLGGKCQLCGYSKCLECLVFHHTNPKNKLFNISGKYCLSFEKLLEEANKCILLCHNCHGEIHYSNENP